MILSIKNKAILTTIFIYLLLMMFPKIVNSQSNDYYSGKIRIIVNDSKIIPQGANESIDSVFAQILSNFNVSNISQVMPFAKTPELRRLYELTTPLNEDSLFNELTRINADNSIFLSVEKCPVPKAVSNPSDYMWWLTTNDPSIDWLWYLQTIQAPLAWDITKGDTAVKVAVTDNGIDPLHPDLIGKLDPPYNFYSGTPFSPQSHGTSVATILAAETADSGQVANGQLASIGYNTKIMFNSWGLSPCVYASTVLNADIISLSWYSGCNSSTSALLAEQEILNNGTTIIRAAGNGTVNCGGQRLYPFSGLEDTRTIVVSSTGKDDKHVNTESCSGSSTNSHYPAVDLCAPGYRLLGGTDTNNGQDEWPYYGCWGGTSQSTPIVSGTVALMHAVNPCLTPNWVQDILKNTTDPILDAANFPGAVGTGRLNAYQAVKEAQNSHSTSLDLYIKDRPEDFGDEQYPYHWQADRDESVDIWVRNQQDGFVNQEHQEPEYQSSTPVYVYVKVRNKSCVDATGSEDLSLYWSKASSWSSWPQNWDGSQPTIGDQIGSINLGNLAAGKDTILEFTWNILNPYIHQNWTSCLLARIENSATDLITIHPGRLDDDVFFNNNIALRNVTVIDIAPGIAAPGRIGDIYYPLGKYMFIGNVHPQAERVNIKFSVSADSLQKSILKEAEVKIILNDVGWNLLEAELINRNDIKILREKEILLLADTVTLSKVLFPANTRIPIYIGFSFLIDKITEQQNFEYHVRQYLDSDSSLLGGVHFEINRYERNPFKANAGDDKDIKAGESVAISAIPISESATYNWYDQEGNLIYEGSAFSISPEITHKYKLEVITDIDGFKDYDEMEVKVNPFWIESISPNPASSQINIDYVADKATSAYLMLLNQTSTASNNYIIDTNLSDKSINISTYQSGVYTLVLVCDGVAVDAKNLVIQ